MKDTLRDDVKRLVGGKRDNANYIALAHKGLKFTISDSSRSFDVSLEGDVEAIDAAGGAVANPEVYGGLLDKGKIDTIHHDKTALFHVIPTGGKYPTEVFDRLQDVFTWVKAS